MVRLYVKKGPGVNREAVKAALKAYFALGGPGKRGALREAALGRVKEPTLHRHVKGHATAESALAAYEGVRKVGHPTQLPKEVEEAVAKLAYLCWQQNRVLSWEQMFAVATLEAGRLGKPFKVRKHDMCRLGSPRRR